MCEIVRAGQDVAETGRDGLSVEVLRASRAAWWDDAFTARLLEVIPADCEQIVDVGCGLGHAAHALLPHLPAAAYLGLDVDASRIALARDELARHGSRASVAAGAAEALPLANDSADVVLFAMTLQHLPDPLRGLQDAARVLRPGGRVVAAEPDNLGMQFYFDGPLAAIDTAIRDVVTAARAVRAPADNAIGPRVAGLMLEAGFSTVTAVVHAVHTTRIESSTAFAERVLRMARTIASCLPTADALDAVTAALAELPRDRDALASATVPVFITTGIARS